jgi:hypothetical protein
MRFKADSSEADFIASFLRMEMTSSRFSERLYELMRRDDIDPSVLINPDLSCLTDNTRRKSLFAEFRGYGLNKDIFEKFPDDLSWSRV